MVVIQNVPHLIEVYSKSGRRGRKIKGAQLGLRHSTAARIGKTLLSCLKMLAEGARFEASTVSETIELDRISLVRSQSLTEESEADQEPVKPDRTR